MPVFDGDLLCKICGNSLKSTRNKKGEKVFYCRVCNESFPIPKNKRYYSNKKLNNTIEDIEVQVVKSSKGHDDKRYNKEHRNYWDIDRPDT